MIRLTKFQELRAALEKLGINEFFDHELEKRLNAGNFALDEADLDDLVFSSNGIYYVKDGTLAKVVIHISDKETHFIQRENETAFRALDDEDFSNEELIRAIHKYHFTYCETLQRMFGSKKKHRYHLSKRTDGLFCYSYISNNTVVKEKSDQKMFACQHCLDNLKRITGRTYTKETFPIEEIYNNPATDNLLLDTGYPLDCDAVPNIYSKDWTRISEREKKNSGYKCQDCGKDFSDSQDRSELHCHHINSDKTNNSSSNLRVLCVECHSKYHPHMHNQNHPANQQPGQPIL